MKINLKLLTVALLAFCATLQLQAQGYIVPNGVIDSGLIPGAGYEIDVMHDPINLYYTGFALNPTGKTPPTIYTNTFLFNPVVDVGVRTFLVSPNTAISLQPILSQSWTELLAPNTYVFANGVPFYLALYTGTGNFHPPNGIYSDPLFGWVELENNQGVIQMLGSALEYQGGGIIAGTQTIIPVPEPSTLGFSALGGLFFAWRRWKARGIAH